jgi:mono/diheme cytochrome c family protein
MLKRLMTFTAVILAATSFAAMAQDDPGQTEYMLTCANCHGETGHGDGPLAGLLTVDVPDLTTLAAANDGVFPFLETMMVVDGRTGVRGHGSNMPVWGDRYQREAADEVGFYGAEMIARGRLVSLVEYLESIQQ